LTRKLPKTGKRRINSSALGLPPKRNATRVIRSAYLLPKKLQLALMNAPAYLFITNRADVRQV
jgi:hypothetical protein